MEDSLEKNNGLRDSGEVPVDIEIEIQGETNGNQTNKESIDANCINVEGSVSGNETRHSATNVEKPVEKLEPGTSQPVKAGRHIQNQNRALHLLASKLFDDRVPLRKKAGVNDKLVYMFSVVSVSDLPRDLVEKPHIVEIFSIFIRYILLLDAACFPFIYY
ncbi:uncharacterized protein [Solanum tuberosum]|uniref:uncharacterized protein n=1 Tax=Solanum tuberosum TaxID=4113 RepID=UPI00073A181E|nr:PREDICTED: uncharacterized protein LOC107058320 [Solanum tuberosum]